MKRSQLIGTLKILGIMAGFILSCLLSSDAAAQTKFAGSQFDSQGKSSFFSFGNFDDSYTSSSCVLRPNKYHKQALETIFKMEEEFECYFIPDFQTGRKQLSYDKFSFDIVSPTSINSSVSNFELEILSGKNKSTRIYSLGALDNDIKGIKKVRWLDFNPSSGREADFSRLKNLKVLFSQDNENYRLGFRPSSMYYGLDFFYPGDIYFWKDVQKATQLESLKFVQNVHNFSYSQSGNMYFLSGISNDFFGNSNLKWVHLKGMDFLPLEFQNLSAFEGVILENTYTPELVNLSAVMYSVGKDTSDGNWGMFLDLVDKDSLKLIPSSGTHRVYYRNGQLVCEGAYRNGKPNGEWKFWYPNGSICQVRHYKDGLRVGNWKFTPPAFNERSIDTIEYTMLEFSGDSLIRRVDQSVGTSPDYDSQCDSGDESVGAVIRSEYRLNHTKKGLNIVKMYCALGPYYKHWMESTTLDTLDKHEEKWDYNETNWEYSVLHYCGGKTPYFVKRFSGEPYKSADFISTFSKNYYPDYFIEERQTIDLKNCTYSFKEYLTRNDTGEITVLIDQTREMSPEE